MNKNKITSPMLVTLLLLSLITCLTLNLGVHPVAGASSATPIELPFYTGFEKPVGGSLGDPLPYSNLVDFKTSNFLGFSGQSGSVPTCQPVAYSSLPPSVTPDNAFNFSFDGYALCAEGYFNGSYSYCYFDLFDSSPNSNYQLPVQLQNHTFISVWYYHANLSCCMIDGELYNARTDQVTTLGNFSYNGQYITDQNGVRIHPAARKNDTIDEWEYACFDLSIVTESDPGPWYLTKLWVGMDNNPNPPFNITVETGPACTYFDCLFISYGTSKLQTQKVEWTSLGEVISACNVSVLTSVIAYGHCNLDGTDYLELKVMNVAWVSGMTYYPEVLWAPFTLMTNVTNPGGTTSLSPAIDVLSANLTGSQDNSLYGKTAKWLLDGFLLGADVCSGGASDVFDGITAVEWAADGVALGYQASQHTAKYTYTWGNDADWCLSDYGEVAVDVSVPYNKSDTITITSYAAIDTVDVITQDSAQITTINVPVNISWTDPAAYRLPLSVYKISVNMFPYSGAGSYGVVNENGIHENGTCYEGSTISLQAIPSIGKYFWFWKFARSGQAYYAGAGTCACTFNFNLTGDWAYDWNITAYFGNVTFPFYSQTQTISNTLSTNSTESEFIEGLSSSYATARTTATGYGIAVGQSYTSREGGSVEQLPLSRQPQPNIYFPPTVEVTPSQAYGQVGSELTFTANASGGSGTYDFYWYINGTEDDNVPWFNSTIDLCYNTPTNITLYCVVYDGSVYVTSNTCTATWYPSPIYLVQRAFLEFDTSSIPANATITSATLNLYGTKSGTGCIIEAQKWSGSPSDGLNRYNKFDNVSYGTIDARSSSSWSDNGWNALTITNLALIQKCGYTKICLRSTDDVNDIAPTGSAIVTLANYSLSVTYTFVAASKPTLTIQGDLNFDGIVNAKDFHLLASFWLTSRSNPNWESSGAEAVDELLANQGAISGKDLHIIALNWCRSINS